jgi:hypothetical protein
MKPEQLYEELKNLAEKLEISVSEQNLDTAAGIKVQSGYCSVKGKKMFIMNRKHNIHKKVKLLGRCLAEIPHEHIFMVPAVREYLEKVQNRLKT